MFFFFFFFYKPRSIEETNKFNRYALKRKKRFLSGKNEYFLIVIVFIITCLKRYNVYKISNQSQEEGIHL